MKPATIVLGLLSLVTVSLVAVAAAAPPSAPTQRFPTPELAAAVLINAYRLDDAAQLGRILGDAGAKLVHSGDAVADARDRKRILAAYDAAHRIERENPARAVLVVGKEEWPLPIPLVRDGRSEWYFDTAAAEQAILDRRVGRNELSVIEVCRAYVEAQDEFATLAAQETGRREYAQHFASRPGSHDGLFWDPAAGAPPSPLGPLVARAQASGYLTERPLGRRAPYHGYYYRILRRQGSHAPGGARDYVIDGHMTGGFALLAYPARYADSGVMTFIVDAEGVVYERNLGPDTERLAPAIDSYDPDAGWSVAGQPSPAAPIG